MKRNLLRVSKMKKLPPDKKPPFEPTTFYKWNHLGKFPQLFIKISGTLFIDLDALDELIESKRVKA